MSSPAHIEGVIIRALTRHTDSRGWLSELFRHDELDASMWPVMAYASITRPGIARGPHEHSAQEDLFYFIGPSDFRVKLWDNRRDSLTFGHILEFIAGESASLMVWVPRGVVHAYRNIGTTEGVVVNCPNALYAGKGRNESVDEIRYENDPSSRFHIE